MTNKMIIGWPEHIFLPDLGIENIKAKVDNGARSSALHVENLRQECDGWVTFEVVTHRRKSNLRKQVRARAVKWGRVRSSTGEFADWGGILKFHALPGDLVTKGQCLATNLSIFGVKQNRLFAPGTGIVLGMTTMPAVSPGEPVFHLAVPSQTLSVLKRKFAKRRPDSLHRRIQKELATNIRVAFE
ncbi:MAG: RimK/LysX family protein [Verrucomicrobia bacterium]|nr:RimK/LysX family protein [Verrucomicrobiota bacterium]